MKNKLTVLLALSLVLFVAVGCGFGKLIGSDEETGAKDSTGKSTDSSSSDSTTEKAPSGETVDIGIAECDELATYMNDNADEIEGSIIIKGLVEVYKQTFLKNIRESVDKMDEKEKAKFADVCKTSLENLKKSMSK